MDVSPTAYKLFNQIADNLPALFTPSCAEGLMRLKLMLSERYSACGYYQRSGSVCYISCLAGSLSSKQRAHLADRLTTSGSQDIEAVGWWFGHDEQDDDDGCTYTHYSYYSILL